MNCFASLDVFSILFNRIVSGANLKTLVLWKIFFLCFFNKMTVVYDQLLDSHIWPQTLKMFHIGFRGTVIYELAISHYSKSGTHHLVRLMPRCFLSEVIIRILFKNRFSGGIRSPTVQDTALHTPSSTKRYIFAVWTCDCCSQDALENSLFLYDH